MNMSMMRLKISSAMTLAVLMAGAYQSVQASPGIGAPLSITARAAPADQSETPDAPPAGHVLKNTYIHQGVLDTTVDAGVTPIDKKISISCAKGPCTIVAHMVLEQGGTTTSGNVAAFELYLDGALAPGDGGYYVGETAIDGTYSNVTQDTIVSMVATGTHTVQTNFFSTDGATIGHYAFIYTVYSP